MSRVGKLPISVPGSVTVDIGESIVTVKGPKGTLSQTYTPEVTVSMEDSTVLVARVDDSKRSRSMHGLYRNLINNMVTGVTEGFTKNLLINGVGYRAEVQGQVLVLNLGYSNPVEYPIPDDLTISCDGPNKIIVTGLDQAEKNAPPL